ncbi:MAG: site-specific integrase, partial [Deltaproteobacteria bacterium]
MNDFAEEFLDVYAATNNKYSTLTAKKSAFKHHLLPAFGRYRLDEIGMRDLEAYKAKKLAAGLKPKSLNNHLIMLRKALSVAVDWELLSHVPKV